jgi:hypothetical protein
MTSQNITIALVTLNVVIWSFVLVQQDNTQAMLLLDIEGLPARVLAEGVSPARCADLTLEVQSRVQDGSIDSHNLDYGLRCVETR